MFRSRTPHHLVRTFALVIATMIACLGCGASAKVHVTKNLQADLGHFEAVNITATGTPAKVARAARKFEEILSKRITAEKVFKSVSSDGEVVLACKVTHMDFGDENTRELTLKGKAEATIEIRITKPDGELLGHITVTATARKKNAEDQPAVRALELAADKVVEYLRAHIKTASPKAAPEKPKAPAADDADEAGDDATTDEDESESNKEATDDEKASEATKKAADE